MIRLLLEQLMHLVVVLPIALFTLKSPRRGSIKVLIAFAFFFIFNKILLHLPLEFEVLRLFESKWNWTGKLLSILGAVLFLSVYRKFNLKDYYLTFKQDQAHFKKGVIILSVIYVITAILDFTFGSARAWDADTILYQLTMPGIHEEMVYRGILLGLLVQILKPNTLIHPAILITSMLFGMAHGLFLSADFNVIFNMEAFLGTMVLGMIWAWITLKTGSILLALASHNLGNVTGSIMSMMKGARL